MSGRAGASGRRRGGRCAAPPREPCGPSAGSPAAAWPRSPCRCRLLGRQRAARRGSGRPSVGGPRPRARSAHLLHAPEPARPRARVGDAARSTSTATSTRACALRGHFGARGLDAGRPRARRRCGRAHRAGRGAPAPPAPCRRRGRATGRPALARAATGPRSATTTTSPTPSTGCCSGPSMVYSCAYFERPGRHARGRPGAQARADLPQAAPRSPASGCSTSAAAGARCCIHAARAPRRARRRRDAVGARRPSSRASGSAAAGLADRIEVRVADYREIDDGPFDKIASVGMYEHVGRARARRATRSTVARAAAPGRAVPQPRHRAAALRAAAGATRFIYRYVFPDGELHAGDRRDRRAAGAPGSRSATSSRCASTTR